MLKFLIVKIAKNVLLTYQLWFQDVTKNRATSNLVKSLRCVWLSSHSLVDRIIIPILWMKKIETQEG